MLVCFGALALSQASGILSDTGTLICGEGYRRRNVTIGDRVARARQAIDTIGAARRGRDPPLVLNAHCSVCDFWSKCQGVAIQRDDLSLLSGMTSKDRSKALGKGILTISQLSYGYRPRRRKRTNRTPKRATHSLAAHVRPPVRHDNNLKALAIKKGRIHVVGAPVIKLEGIPTFLDIKRMPRGLLLPCRTALRIRRRVLAERAFWADGPEDERVMWGNCLQTLKSIGTAQLVHYGAYETRFLRTMKKRYVTEPDEGEFVDRLIGSSVNLVACIYGRVYFPTYSNSLKEVAGHLGYAWAWPHASGASSVLMRRTWELSAVGDVKTLLLAYNMDDCRAAAVVADALTRICAGGPSAPDSVNVGSLEVGFQRTFGKFDSALPDFAKINARSLLGPQRSKVFVRTDKCVRRTVRKSERRRNLQESKRTSRSTMHRQSAPNAPPPNFGGIPRGDRTSSATLGSRTRGSNAGRSNTAMANTSAANATPN